ncbi:MAG TPA: glycosyltransferase [Ktedonobacterales bacterium]|nr:glycosyltransferase [Ktedonobacterales bacterium]
MARIVISTVGSSGDLNPFLALGLGLRERGHDVLFAVEERMSLAIREAGFPVHPLTGDGQEIFEKYSAEFIDKLTPIASLRVVVERYLLPALRTNIEELRAACEGADILVTAAVQLAASFVVDQTGVPWASLALTPVVVPSAYVAPVPGLYLPGPLQRAVNRFFWTGGILTVRHIADRPVNRIRQEYGLPPLRDVMYTGNLSHEYTAVAISPTFIPRPPDWPSYVVETGFLYWDTPDSWQEPEALTSFLARPEPVIAVSSGSMGPEVKHAFTQFFATSIEAVKRAGARALIIGAAPGVLPDPLPEGVFATPFAPFSRVYPRCAAVIHHGGIGTTAQSLRAGVPTLIVPWGVDQYFHGEAVKQLGAGRWMQRRFYRVRRASSVLKALITDPRYRQRAQAVAAELAREDGLVTLCDGLEGVLRRQPARA